MDMEPQPNAFSSLTENDSLHSSVHDSRNLQIPSYKIEKNWTPRPPMTPEVAYDLIFELLDLDSLCSNVSTASNCYNSQDVSSCFLLLPLLKPCQDGPLTSRASLGSKKSNFPATVHVGVGDTELKFRE